MLAVGSDEGDIDVFGVVFVNVYHHSLIAEGLEFTV